jgi:hypothetical protein
MPMRALRILMALFEASSPADVQLRSHIDGTAMLFRGYYRPPVDW